MRIDEDTRKRVRERVIHYTTYKVASTCGTTVDALIQLAHGNSPALSEETWFRLARRMSLI
jgi:hypothetical protein